MQPTAASQSSTSMCRSRSFTDDPSYFNYTRHPTSGSRRHISQSSLATPLLPIQSTRNTAGHIPRSSLSKPLPEPQPPPIFRLHRSSISDPLYRSSWTEPLPETQQYRSHHQHSYSNSIPRTHEPKSRSVPPQSNTFLRPFQSKPQRPKPDVTPRRWPHFVGPLGKLPRTIDSTRPHEYTIICTLAFLVVHLMCLMLAARFPTQTVRVAFVSISGFVLIAMACIVVVDLVKHSKSSLKDQISLYSQLD